MAPTPPTHRHRSKSAPRARGKSPDPKALKLSAKSEAQQGLVTPPPKRRSRSSSPKEVAAKRAISFGENKVHAIQAENKGPSDMKKAKATAIVKNLREELAGACSSKCA